MKYNPQIRLTAEETHRGSEKKKKAKQASQSQLPYQRTPLQEPQVRVNFGRRGVFDKAWKKKVLGKEGGGRK